MDCIIGVDIGTTSTKAIAYTKTGSILSQHAINYPVYNPHPTYSEQDPEEIFQAVLSTIRYSWQLIKSDYNLKGISFSSPMHGIMPVDKDCRPLTNCIIWADTRSKDIASRIKNGSDGKFIYQRTGTPIHPMAPLSKILWLKENMQDIFNSAYKFISFKEYVFYKLFGKFIIDYSIASSTGLFDIYDLKWNKTALKTAGINAERLSLPVPTNHIEKLLDSPFLPNLGIESGAPFIVGASDGCLANLGNNVISKGKASITIGTSGAIRIASKQPIQDPKERIFNYLLTSDHYVAGGPVNNGGIVLQWFFENIIKNKLELNTSNDVNDYSADLEKASRISAGSDGLIFLPYILGERAPHWNAEARGVFFGLNINHTKNHMLKAVLEGIIFGIYNIAEALESTNEEIEVIYANGGFAKSTSWVQILTDIFGKTVLVSESIESSAKGAAIMGMHALGLIDKMDSPDLFQEKIKTFTPDQNKHELYKKYYRIFTSIYEKLRDEFENLNNLLK
ncbi:gluconokinase [soil metagenome]